MKSKLEHLEAENLKLKTAYEQLLIRYKGQENFGKLALKEVQRVEDLAEHYEHELKELESQFEELVSKCTCNANQDSETEESDDGESSDDDSEEEPDFQEPATLLYQLVSTGEMTKEEMEIKLSKLNLCLCTDRKSVV